MAWPALIDPDDLLQLSLEDLRRVWDDLPELYQDALVTHPRTPPLLLWHAVMTGPWRVWRMGWVRDDIPQELAWDLFVLGAFSMRPLFKDIARHQSLTPDMLVVLTELGDSDVRWQLVNHRNVPDEVLERLAHDPHREIKRYATKTLKARRALRGLFKKG